MHVLIAGGGVGGLALALMLHQRGIGCTVLEAAPEVKPLGVGINTLPHAIRELAALDLLPALDGVGIRTRELRYLNRFGQEIWKEPRGIWAGHEVPQFSIHRGHLHQVLWQAAEGRLPAGALLRNARLQNFTQNAHGITAHLMDGRSLSGDVLIGADGSHSIIRASLHPDDGGIRWNGIQMWRGAVEWPAFEGGDTMIVAGDMKEKLVLYPIGAGASAATRLTNWVVCAQIGDASKPPPRREDWSRAGQLDELGTLRAVAAEQLGAEFQRADLLGHWSELCVHAAEEHQVGLLALQGGQDGGEIRGFVVGELAADDLAAGGLDRFLELIGDALAVGRAVVDDRDALGLHVLDGVAPERTTELAVMGDDAERCLEALQGVLRVGRRRRDLRNAGVVVDLRGGDGVGAGYGLGRRAR